jgi:hypothetical protein
VPTVTAPMGGPDGETPRLQSQDVSADSLHPPHLRGEHGQLQSWISVVLERLRLETKEDLHKVYEAINTLAGRVSVIEGGETERSRWRARIEDKLDTALASPASEPAHADNKRGWLTERTVPLMLGAGLMVCVLVLVFAILFGPASTGKAIRDIRQEAGQAR